MLDYHITTPCFLSQQDAMLDYHITTPCWTITAGRHAGKVPQTPAET